MAQLENANPEIFQKAEEREVLPEEEDDDVYDEIDAREVFDLIRCINDPEHPLTLEELKVLQQDHIEVNDAGNHVTVYFTPTIPHCSMATLIGLSIRVRLLRALPERFKGVDGNTSMSVQLPFEVDVKIHPGTHASEHAVNKQLADKERVAAALENNHLLEVVNQCLTIKSQSEH